MKEKFEALKKGHDEAFQRTFAVEGIELLEKISNEIIRVLKAGNKIMLCGNGGSAADCQHIAAEFVVRFEANRISLPAIALTSDSSVLTATSNDYSFEQVFSRQVEGVGKKGDILIAISTSGTSKNVLNAVEKAKEMGILTLGFTGQRGQKISDLTDLCFIAQTSKTAFVQEMYIAALHSICGVVEQILFSS